MVCVLEAMFWLLSVTVSVAVSDSGASGVKFTAIAQLVPTLRVVEAVQLEVPDASVKLLASAPEMLRPDKFSVAVPRFVSVTVCELVLPTLVLAKVSGAGVPCASFTTRLLDESEI